MDEEYHRKLEENKRLAEEATAKKRAKRLKKKQGRKQKKRMKAKKVDNVDEKHSENDSSDEDEEETRTVESSEMIEENDGCSTNVYTSESEAKAATEKESSLSTKENQDVLKVSPEVSSENVQCENGT